MFKNGLTCAQKSTRISGDVDGFKVACWYNITYSLFQVNNSHKVSNSETNSIAVTICCFLLLT